MRFEEHELLDRADTLEDLPDGVLADALGNPGKEDLQNSKTSPFNQAL